MGYTVNILKIGVHISANLHIRKKEVKIGDT